MFSYSAKILHPSSTVNSDH